MKFGDLFKDLAEKAGIKLEDETLKKILSATEVSQLDLPVEFANALQNNLLTEQSAAVNTNVRAKLFAEALGSLDSELDKIPRDFEFSEELKAKYGAIQKNTKDKLKLVMEGLKGKLEDATKKANEKPQDHNAKEEVRNLQDQIALLNQKNADLQKLHETELANLNDKHLSERKTFALISALAGIKLPENNLPAEVNQLTAKTLIENDMANKGLQVEFNAAGKPVLKEMKNGAWVDYYFNQKPVPYSDYISGVLASNKFVQVSNSTPPPPPGSVTPPPNANPANHATAQNLREQARQLQPGATV